LSESLERLGVEPIDPVGLLRPGEDWAESIQHAVDEADAMVFLVGSETARETVLQRDWSMALERSWSYPDKPLIPVVLGDVQLPAFLRDRQAIRAEPEGDMSAVATAIVQAIQGRQSSFSLAPTAPEPAQVEERKQRIEEIAQQADQMTPTPEELQRQAQELTDRIAQVERLRPDTQELAELHVKLADILKALNRGADALPHLESAAAILAHYPDAKRRYARVRMNRAALLARLEHYPEARQEWIAVRDLYRDMDGETSVAAMFARAALLPLHTKAGDTAAAKAEWDCLTKEAKQLIWQLLPPGVKSILEWLRAAQQRETNPQPGGDPEPPKARGD
jgi:tetratricopeptide (TPR) repeat protein